MEVQPCTTKLVEVMGYNVKTREYDRFMKRKYTCPKCQSIDIAIRRGHRDLADGECKSCANKWHMTLRSDVTPAQVAQAKKDYDMIAIYEEQLPL